MEIGDYMRLVQVGVETAAIVAAPILGIGLIAGLAVSIFQTATQISDSSIAFIPKIGSAVLGILVFGPFMINRLSGFTIWIYSQIPVLLK